MEEHHQKLEGRVSVLENAMLNLAKTVDEGFAQQQKTSKALWDQMKTIDADRKPNYALWIATGMLMIALFSGLYTLIGLRLDGSVTPIKLSLQEIETQFDADAQLRNVQFSEQQRMFSILWNSSKLGKLSPFPAGPYYQPNVSNRGGR